RRRHTRWPRDWSSDVCSSDLKTEVIVQKSHRFPYDHMVRNCGVSLIEVETREELERVITPKTAMLLFLNKAAKTGKIGMEEFVRSEERRVGKECGARGGRECR